MAQTIIEKIQDILDVDSDGVWGPISRKALQTQIDKTSDSNPTLVKIQKLLGVDPATGQWREASAKAFEKALNGGDGGGGGNGPFEADVSSFADPKDIADFEKCKALGRTDKECFKVGDNGIGKFGKFTAQTTTPMVAIHPNDAKKRWGSMDAAAHRKVRVTVGSKSVLATVEDQLGVAGRIDLNPAAAKALGLKPPIDPDETKCTWEWIV